MFRCKINATNEIRNINMSFFKNGYIPAITVCFLLNYKYRVIHHTDIVVDSLTLDFSDIENVSYVALMF